MMSSVTDSIILSVSVPIPSSYLFVCMCMHDVICDGFYNAHIFIYLYLLSVSVHVHATGMMSSVHL